MVWEPGNAHQPPQYPTDVSHWLNPKGNQRTMEQFDGVHIGECLGAQSMVIEGGE